MTAEWICERCGTRSDVSGKAVGDFFRCPKCGRQGTVAGTPEESDRALKAQTAALGRKVGLVFGLTCVVLFSGVAGIVRFAMVAQARNKTSEPVFLLQRLCINVRETYNNTGEWVAAGPEPKTVPGKDKVEFPMDAQFEKLGFAPGMVRYQYQVLLEGGPNNPKVSCVARGDLDGDGVTSYAEVHLDERDMPTPIAWQHEFE